MNEVKKLYRSRENQMIGGVCGGIAHYFNIDPTIVRLIFVAILLVLGTGLLAYIVAWIIIPLDPNEPDRDDDDDDDDDD